MSTGYGIFDVIRDDLVVVYLVFFFVLVHISLEILEKADVFYHYVKEIRATLNSVWQVRERESGKSNCKNGYICVRKPETTFIY